VPSKSSDQSHLDQKYFVTHDTYNCPYCNRRQVSFRVTASISFDWSDNKRCFAHVVECQSCKNESLHLTYDELTTYQIDARYWPRQFGANTDLDNAIFYSQPTSFFVMDSRIPRVLRELMSEAEGCLKMDFLVGASACARKAIYELLVEEEVWDKADHYDERIKALKGKYPSVDARLFDTLAHLQGLASDLVHEQSWKEWDSANFRLVLGTLRSILVEMYVVPAERDERYKAVLDLKERASGRPPGIPPGTDAQADG